MTTPERMPELLIIGGKPYSGKSTIARALVKSGERPKISHLPMGEHLRGIAAGQIESQYTAALAKNVGALKAHAPVDRDIPIKVLEEFMAQHATSDLVVLDGFPRYPKRLDDFKASVQRMGTGVIAVCRVNISDQEVFKRSPYRPQRYNDTPEDMAFVQTRLDEYQSTISQVLDSFAAQSPNSFYELDGAATVKDNVGIIRTAYLSHTTQDL